MSCVLCEALGTDINLLISYPSARGHKTRVNHFSFPFHTSAHGQRTGHPPFCCEIMSVLEGLSLSYRPYLEKLTETDLFSPAQEFALTSIVEEEMEEFKKTGKHKRPPRVRFPNLFTNLGNLDTTRPAVVLPPPLLSSWHCCIAFFFLAPFALCFLLLFFFFITPIPPLSVNITRHPRSSFLALSDCVCYYFELDFLSSPAFFPLLFPPFPYLSLSLSKSATFPPSPLLTPCRRFLSSLK